MRSYAAVTVCYMLIVHKHPAPWRNVRVRMFDATSACASKELANASTQYTIFLWRARFAAACEKCNWARMCASSEQHLDGIIPPVHSVQLHLIYSFAKATMFHTLASMPPALGAPPNTAANSRVHGSGL